MFLEYPGLIALAALVLGIASFLLGWDVAETRERRAKRVLDANIRLLIRQKKELSDWVRANWPDEFAAYRRGHAEGYQQGVLHSPELEDTV